MQLSAILDVAIGLSLIFLTLAAICSSINELIARAMRLRSQFLVKGIRTLLSDQNGELSADVLRHPLIRRLGTNPRLLPAYIPSSTFALAVVDSLRSRAGGATAMVSRLQEEIQKVADTNIRQPLANALSNPDARLALDETRLAIAAIQDPDVRASIAGFFNALEVNEIKQGILNIPDPTIQQTLLALLSDTETQIQRLEDVRKRIEDWFNDGMDHVSEAYKRYVEWILRGLAVIVCFAFNADALQITKNLWEDPTLRAALVAQAQAVTQNQAPGTTQNPQSITEQAEKVSQAFDQLLGLPLGWNCKVWNDITRAGWKLSGTASSSQNYGFCEVVQDQAITGGSFGISPLIAKLAGLILMSAGVSAGAPFWFNLLSRIVPMRQDKPK